MAPISPFHAQEAAASSAPAHVSAPAAPGSQQPAAQVQAQAASAPATSAPAPATGCCQGSLSTCNISSYCPSCNILSTSSRSS
ncbi:hypothetical protein U1Q18_005524 [Sarracenia purpurea var. burkii]